MTARYSRWGLYGPWIGFALLALGWCAWWVVLKETSIRVLREEAAKAVSAGGVATFEPVVEARGFPLHLTLVLRGAAYSPAGATWRVDAATLPVSVNVVDPRHVIVDLRHGFAAALTPGRTYQVDPRRGQMSLRFDDAGLKRLSIAADGVAIQRPDKAPVAIGEVSAHVRPDPRNIADLQLVSSLTGLAGPLHAIQAAVVVQGGASVSAAQWASAPLRIEALDLSVGEGKASGAGTLRLAETGMFEAAFTLRTQTPRALAQALSPRAAFLFPERAPMSVYVERADDGWRVEALTGG